MAPSYLRSHSHTVNLLLLFTCPLLATRAGAAGVGHYDIFSRFLVQMTSTPLVCKPQHVGCLCYLIHHPFTDLGRTLFRVTYKYHPLSPESREGRDLSEQRSPFTLSLLAFLSLSLISHLALFSGGPFYSSS